MRIPEPTGPFPKADSRAGQHSDGNGPFEVFYIDSTLIQKRGCRHYECGWYWWSCSPGCMPDGEAQGPYATSTEAWQDAKAGDYDDAQYTEPAKYGNT